MTGSSQPSLATHFLAHLSCRAAQQGEPDERLEAALARFVDAAASAWPAVELPAHTFLGYVAARLDGAGSLEAALGELHAGDLYLACACAAGHPRALAAFEHHFLSAVPRFVARIDASESFADEVMQQLRTKLLVDDGRVPPKILDYRGRGPLGGWLRVASVRTARNLLRGQDRAFPRRVAAAELPLTSPTPDPELQVLKERCGREVRDAFEKTLSALPAKQRNVLRLYYLEALSSNAIAELFGVSGAAVRLWIKQCREAVLAETSRLLQDRLALNSAELESMVGLVRSRFDLTLSRVLSTRPGK